MALVMERSTERQFNAMVLGKYRENILRFLNGS